MPNDAKIGTYSPDVSITPVPEVLCTEPGLYRRIEKRWIRKWIEQTIRDKLPELNPTLRRGTARIAADLFQKQTFLAGSTGSGKTRALYALFEFFVSSGASVLILEAKHESVETFLAIAYRAGLRPDQVVIISPTASHVPGISPLAGNLPLTVVSAFLVDVIMGSGGGTVGPRMTQFLGHLLCLIGVHPDLTLLDAAAALQDADLLVQFTERPAPRNLSADDRLAHDMAVAYFRNFLQASRSERATVMGPIITRLSEMARSSFWHGILDTTRNNVDFSTLWDEQKVVVCHLDVAALGVQGVRLLSGFLGAMIYRTAFQKTGKRQTFVVADEAAVQSYLSELILQILAIGRGLLLSTVVVCQFLEQLDGELKASLLSQPAVSMYFRLGYADAREIAGALSAGAEPQLKRLTVGGTEGTGKKKRPFTTTVREVIFDEWGRPLAFSLGDWQRFNAASMLAVDVCDELYSVAKRSAIGRLYVHDDGTPTELRRYLSGVTDEVVSIIGPKPVQVEVSFVPPTLDQVERATESDQARYLAKVLSNLPVAHCVLKTPGQAAEVVKMVDVPDAVIGPRERAFIDAALRANGRSPEEIAAAIAARRARSSRPVVVHSEEVVDDGSLF